MAIKVFHRDQPDQMLPIIARDARLVVWPGVGARTANMNYVDMQPGEKNVPHVHANSEDTRARNHLMLAWYAGGRTEAAMNRAKRL